MADHHNAIDTTRPGHYGAAGTGVTIAETMIVAAWNVQGDPARASFVEVRRVFDIALPTSPNNIATTGALTAVWLGPRSWLLVAGGVSPLVAYAEKRDALNNVGSALFDVTASRVAWTVSGPRATDVLAKGCPLDFHPLAFSAGTCAQSLLGHVNALLIKHNEAPTFTVMVARSFARGVLHALVESAAQYGCDVQPPGSLR